MNWFTEIVHYKLVNITDNTPDFVNIITNIIVKYNNILDEIVINKVYYSTRNSDHYYAIFLTS